MGEGTWVLGDASAAPRLEQDGSTDPPARGVPQASGAMRRLLSNWFLVEQADSQVAQAIRDREVLRIEAAQTLFYLVKDGSLDEEPVTELLAFAYWNTDIEVSMIASAVGVTAHELHRRVPPQETGYPCGRCGLPIFATSRSHLHELAGRRYSDPLHPTCRDEDREQQSAQYRREKDERKRRLEELRSMPYKKYLWTPEWIETRNAARKRARYRCQVCSSANRLNVHHRTYERRGQEENRDLIVLCEDCHMTFHRSGALRDYEEPGA